ncbi:MAG: YicC family protein [Ignavibacteria bacterium]|nr:YicC family protein [Ignavibacteria bacterium]
MTGFGRGEAAAGDVTIAVEVRSVNSRFLEVATRLPRPFPPRENEIKEAVRKRVERGKVTVSVTIERSDGGEVPLRVNVPAARAYYSLLKDIRKSVKSKESIKLEHLLRFSDIIEQDDEEEIDKDEWALLETALERSLDELERMRSDEGGELQKDLESRIGFLGSEIDRAEELSKKQVPAEKLRLRERITQLINTVDLDEGRLETEVAFLADKIDVTEECVRFRSHNKFFLEALRSREPVGRKLNFLVQEMNREVNTIGSKSSSTEIAHLVVGMKEEMEKIREQLQNVE